MRNKAIIPITLTIFAAMAAMPVQAQTSKPMTVEQLQQALADARARHLSDNDTVRALADVELTAQLRPDALRRLTAASPGLRTTEALRGLADASVFLDPPASEIPPAPAPDLAAQKAILSKTIHYVARVIPTLPDFMATRVTEHFDDTPLAFQQGGWPVRIGLHLDGSFEAPISFMDGGERDGSTVSSAPALKKVDSKKLSGAAKAARGGSGLNSWGEFRTILGIVLVDVAKGKMSWARWEQVGDQRAAVFQFQVDRSSSHYDVQFSRNRPSAGKAQPVAKYEFRQTSGYHGHIAVDPETGAVLRVVIDADVESGSPIHRASMMVEYGPVQIGTRSYICPVRSISVSASDEVYQPTSQSPFQDLVELQVNETSFSGYRRFGSEATIFSDTHPASEPASESVASASPSTTMPSKVETVVAGTPGTPPAVAGDAARASDPSAAEAIAAASAAPSAEAIAEAEEKSDQEILIRAIESLPGENSDSAAGDEAAANGGSITMRATTRLVDIGLVAYNKHGNPITDLKQSDIEVYDNGRKQELRGFHHAAPATDIPSQPVQTSQSPDTFTNTPTVSRVVQDAPDLLILLLDESHLPFQDLNRARGEVLRFLAATRSSSRLALYAFSEHGFRVIQDITQDHALVAKKLATWMPPASSVSQAQDLDKRNRQQFDTVRTNADMNYVNGNFIEVPDYVQSTDPQLRQMGQNPLRASLEAMLAVAQHFSTVPGHKSLAWIAGDSVLADWDDQAVGMDKSVKQMDAVFKHTREALSEAHIALYAVDASAQSAGGIDSSLENRNVEVNQVNRDNPQGGGNPRIGAAARVQGQMQADLHGIQGPVRELVESTGGRAINRGGDLKATLDGIDRDLNGLYEVGFDPDTPADGKFHTLVVKIPSRKDVKLRYRNSYLYAEESTTTKQRFQQAIWSAADASDLTLTAQAVPASDAAGEGTVKLHIHFPGLALEQKDGRWTDQLYIFVAQRDDSTQKAAISGDTLRLSLKQATYESGVPEGIPYQHTVEGKSKLGSVRVIVIDGNSGRMGSVTLPTSVFHP